MQGLNWVTALELVNPWFNFYTHVISSQNLVDLNAFNDVLNIFRSSFAIFLFSET